MMNIRWLALSLLSLITIIFTVSSCENPLVEAPEKPPELRFSIMKPADRASAQKSVGEEEKISPYACFMSVRQVTPDGAVYWRWWNIWLHYPKGIAKKANGYKAMVRVRLYDGNTLQKFSNCWVPATRQAANMLQRLLIGKVKQPASQQKRRSMPIGDTNDGGYHCPDGYHWVNAKQMSCTDGNGNYSLPVLVVEDDPPSPPPPDDDPPEEPDPYDPPDPPGGSDDPCFECDPGGEPGDNACQITESGGMTIGCRSEPCYTNGEHPVLEDATVQQAMDDAWLESYGPATNPLPHGQRKEALFMVLATMGGYEIEKIYGGPDTSSCHFDANNVSIPSNIAALIHTHPYSSGDIINDPRCGPGVYDGDDVSSGDESLMQTIDNSTILPPIPMYVIDKDKIRIIQASNPSQYSETINRCGY